GVGCAHRVAVHRGVVERGNVSRCPEIAAQHATERRLQLDALALERLAHLGQDGRSRSLDWNRPGHAREDTPGPLAWARWRAERNRSALCSPAARRGGWTARRRRALCTDGR